MLLELEKSVEYKKLLLDIDEICKSYLLKIVFCCFDLKENIDTNELKDIRFIELFTKFIKSMLEDDPK